MLVRRILIGLNLVVVRICKREKQEKNRKEKQIKLDALWWIEIDGGFYFSESIPENFSNTNFWLDAILW